MNAPAPLVPKTDIESQMLLVARNLAMDIYPLDQILEMVNVTNAEFDRWRNHPRFLKYLQEEKIAWEAASNTAERTKLKAATVMEQFMLQAHAELHDKKQPLNHRVELGKLVSRIAGMGEAKVLGGEGGGGFRLQINIGSSSVNIAPQAVQKVINYDDAPTYDHVEVIDEDGNDLLATPHTLED